LEGEKEGMLRLFLIHNASKSRGKEKKKKRGMNTILRMLEEREAIEYV